MQRLLKVAGCALIPALLLGRSADASARKCRATPGGTPVLNATPILIIDGVVKGEMKSPSGSTGPELGIGLQVDSAEVASVSVVCLEFDEANRTVARSVVSVITKRGGESLMKSHLTALVQLQAEYQIRTGVYAASLATLGFFTSRVPLPIEMQVGTSGWSAKSVVKGVATECHVKVGAGVPENRAPLVICE